LFQALTEGGWGGLIGPTTIEKEMGQPSDTELLLTLKQRKKDVKKKKTPCS